MIDDFDNYLSVLSVSLNFNFKGFGEIEWSPFWLNPRRLRQYLRQLCGNLI